MVDKKTGSGSGKSGPVKGQDKTRADKPRQEKAKIGELKNDLTGMFEKLTTLTENQVTERVKESANQIWLAGLGAYAKAEKEGTKLFEGLVRDGEKLESKTRDFVERQITTARDQVSAARGKVDEVRAKATGSWGKVERAFDERVSNALHRLDIPTKMDFDSVAQRIDELSDRVRVLAEERDIPFLEPESDSKHQ